MTAQDFKKAFQDFLKAESTVEEAYAAYANFVEEKQNATRLDDATHEVVWTVKSSRGRGIENMLLSLARAFTKTPKPTLKPFSFKSLHTLDTKQVQELDSEQERSVELQNLSTIFAGVAMWMFVLSFAMIPLVGMTGVVLCVVSILIFVGSVIGISKAHFRFLPEEFRSISADHWSIKSLVEK